VSDWLLLGTAISLILASYLAALNLAMLDFSRTALHRRLESTGKAQFAQRFLDQLDQTSLAVSLLRTASRVAFVVLVLVSAIGTGETTTLTWPALVGSSLIAIALLWIFSSVLAQALAKHAAVGLLCTGLPVLRSAALLGRPLARGVFFIDEAIRRLSGANLRKDDQQAEEELLQSIEDTHREGGLDVTSATLMENVVEFSGTDAAEVMTPRTDIEGLEVTDELAKIRAFIVQVGHSRIPVFTDDIDHIIGILYVKDLVQYIGQDPATFKLEPILRQSIVVPETKPVSELLADFQRSEVHMAIVIDEYGGTAGLVTIEDVLEEIVGEIHDEHEPDGADEPKLVKIDEVRAEVDGRFHIDDLNERLGLTVPEDDDFDTIGGFMLAQLGHVPNVGEALEAHSARFTAIAATRTHIQRVRIELLGQAKFNGERGEFSNEK